MRGFGRTRSILLIVALAITPLRAAGQVSSSAAIKIDFAREVAPVFQKRCYGCHGPQMQTSGFRLDVSAAAMRGGNSGPVILPGNSAGSPLVRRISGSQGVPQMPPAGPRLTADEVRLIRAWIDQGAVWPAEAPIAKPTSRPLPWSFQPVGDPSVPAVRNRSWVRNEIDSFILARLEKESIEPSAEASKATLLRRLSLDLIGLPPAREEVAEFLADNRPDAYERQVSRLLDSPHYGERWARPWLDMARYADSDGYEKDWVRPYAWRYRQWVILALNSNMPFDQFTIEQIAGDLLPHATVEQKVATGFHRNTLTNREGGVDNEYFRFENVMDRSSAVGSVWLGLTIGCAQCHDHKFDPISQRDFYRMAAFFDNVDEVDIDAPLPGELGPYLRTRAEYRSKREELLAQYHVAEVQAEWERRMLEASANPGKWTDWDLAWEVLLKATRTGDGAQIIRKKPEERTEREQDTLVDHFIEYSQYAFGPKRYGELKFKELFEKLNKLRDSYPQLTQAMIVAESQTRRKSYIRLRGDYKALGIEVQPGTLDALRALDSPGALTRLDLARWIVNPKNPLTARVTVNRYWQEFFGQGLVKSAEDFGTQGDRPTHPELLDWLATRFVASGWNVKAIQKRIVMSATYRQSSADRGELRTKDPNNLLLAHQARLRLSAELIRDAALSVSGLMDPSIGGPSIHPYQPKGVADLGYANSVKWQESQGRERYRRGLYIHFQRTTPYPLLVNFDAPKGNLPVCRRLRTNTPLQALNLLNDPVFVEAAEAMAYRLETESPPDFWSRLRYAFELALGRPPEPAEADRLAALFEKQIAILKNEPESAAALASGAKAGSPDTAAWTVLSSVLLNLDEFITRE